MSFLTEFKKFAMRGNVLDMAVGIIMGGAFTPIVNSLVNDIIMPPIGILLGNVDFSQLAITIKAATETTPAVTINYGLFINTIISFLIVAFAVFLLVKRRAKNRQHLRPHRQKRNCSPRFATCSKKNSGKRLSRQIYGPQPVATHRLLFLPLYE